jgi:hypothetical protein
LFSCSDVQFFNCSAVQFVQISVFSLFRLFSCSAVQLFSATADSARNEMPILFVQIGPFNLSRTEPLCFSSLRLATLLAETRSILHNYCHYTRVRMLALLLHAISL